MRGRTSKRRKVCTLQACSEDVGAGSYARSSYSQPEPGLIDKDLK